MNHFILCKMVKQISCEWLTNEAHPALEHVYEHIGVTWTIEERERMLRKVSHTIFPPHRRSDAWQGYDRTRYTENNQFFYPVTASLGASPNIWFKNLRLLQVRKKLRLISSLRVSMSEPSLLSGKILAKLKALEEVVGKDMMAPTSVPLLRTPAMRPSSSNIRAEYLRNSGLAARNARNQ